MRSRSWGAAVLAGAIASCGDATGPTDEITLTFCPAVSWAGYQNEGGEWVSLPTFGFIVRATERLVITTIEQGVTAQTLTFHHLTRDQAQATFDCQPAGFKSLTGTVSGVSGSVAAISMGTRVTSATQTFPAFTLTEVPSGALDLVASYSNLGIVRRAVNYPEASAIPVLDFGSAEAFALQANALTIVPNGVVAPQWVTAVVTPRGTLGRLAQSGPPCCPAGTILTLPASRLESGDLHYLMVSGGGGGDFRIVRQFHATASDRTVTFGPPLSRPTFTTLGTAGQFWRVEIAAQPEYGAQVELIVTAAQPSTNTTRTVIKASREYFAGTPTTWTFTVPDLSGVAGFPAGYPQTPVPGAWQFFAREEPWLFSPLTARAGDVYRSAETR